MACGIRSDMIVASFSWNFLQLAQGCEKLDAGLETLHRLSLTSYPNCLTGSHAAFLEVS